MRTGLVLLVLCCAGLLNAASAAPEAAVNTDPGREPIILPVPANDKLPSIFLIGDSTVRNGRDDGQGKGAEGQWGWGNPIAAYFDPARVNLANRAIGGLSSRTYLTGGHWDRTLALLKPGDIVIMQFGHNDGGAINDTSRARATIKGAGEDTVEIDNMLTRRHEVVHSYGWYLKKYIADARAKGATAIVLSPVPRKTWDSAGRIARASGDYALWAAQAAREANAGFIDLNELAAREYDRLGHDAVMRLFPLVTPDEHTHTNLAGAELNARLVIAGLRSLEIAGLPAFLGNKARTIDASKAGGLVGKPPAEFARVAAAVDERPVVEAPRTDEQARDPVLPTLYVVGDSTVKTAGKNGAYGWGERIGSYFDAAKINLVNRAIAGRSSRTFLTEGRWDKLLAGLKPGDFVLIQFGHNDGGRIGDPAMKNRASGPGTGPETVEDSKPDGSPETVHTFGWYMAKYVADARAKGATVILCSPIPHRDRWQPGQERDFADFAAWDKQVATKGGALYIDLTSLITDGYRGLGPQRVDAFFADARTHTNDAGARFNAARVVDGLKGLAGNPLGSYFSDMANADAAPVSTPVPPGQVAQEQSSRQ
jgi:lysophospholipase L1-like esterase